MKKEVTLVPKDKCPFDILTEIAERIESSWIFLHTDIVKKLTNSSDSCDFVGHYFTELTWNATKNFPSTFLSIEGLGTWRSIYRIKKDNKLEYSCSDPEEIFFWQMGD